MFKKSSKLYLIFVVLVAAGCSLEPHNTPTLPPSVAPTNMIMGTSTLEPSKTDTPTATLPLETSTPALTKRPDTTNERLTEQCFIEYPGLPKEIIPPGALVIETTEGISLLNFESQTNRKISRSITAVGTSPDGKWLVYSVYKNQSGQLLIFESDKEKTIQISAGLSWLLSGKIRWLDNQRIWFPEISTLEPATSVVVLDPFSDENVVIQTDYPGVWPYLLGSSPRMHFGYSSVAYDPSLNFVIYPELDEFQGYFQTLWDRKNQRVVARIRDDGSYGNLPLWHEDKEQFLVAGYPSSPRAGNKEWLTVDIDGETKSLTNFGAAGKNYEIGNGASLSPDGKTLAFKIVFEKDGKYYNSASRLILLDLETGEGIDTCLPVDRIVWSTNGQYLAISTPLENGIHDRILLIEKKTKKGYLLLEGSQVFPVGWLAQP